MTEREIADRIRATLTVHSDPDLARLADELDPPRPEPGTVVWWSHANDTGSQYLGYVVDRGIASLHHPESVRDNYVVEWDNIEWKPARIAGPMQEIVDIPPTREWDDNDLDIRVFIPGTEIMYHRVTITRDEAARREAEG